MDKIHSIRQLYYEQGKTIPEIITETGHDRKTITKYLDMTDFNAPEPVTPNPEGICPKLEPYKSLIDTWLMEDKKVPRKQRHTARRVYRRLGKEADGFDCSCRLVAQYVAFRKSQMHLDNRNGYLPLIHHPGEGQADFGAARFYENSFCREGKYLVLSFPHSNGGYFQLMYGENTECFMESMIAIFEHIGGIPTEIWFDNTSTIVTKILKVLAELTDRTGFDSALQTINQALLYQVTDPDSLKNLYRRLYSDVPEMSPLPQQSGIPNVAQMPADLSAYDRLLKKGGAVNG